MLKDNEQVHFKLRCRKFIEMVRRSAELNNQKNGVGKKSNGHGVDVGPNEMDLDENGFSDNMETEDGLDSSTADEQALLNETVGYGRKLQEEFKNDPRREIHKALQDVFSLMAYANPLEVKEISHLFDQRGRMVVAEELNSAILRTSRPHLAPFARILTNMCPTVSLGRSSRSALENLYGQTSVLLDYLREDGGSGSFVTIQSVIDEIPKSLF